MLDNLEHLLPAVTLLGELLQRCPNASVLATSRTPLHLYGERRYPVPPLALAGDGDPAASAAVELFVRRAQAVDPGFDLTRDNTSELGAICRALDGLPLAIELAAARVDALAPHEIKARLEHRLDLLTDGARDLLDRQRTMRGRSTGATHSCPQRRSGCSHGSGCSRAERRPMRSASSRARRCRTPRTRSPPWSTARSSSGSAAGRRPLRRARNVPGVRARAARVRGRGRGRPAPARAALPRRRGTGPAALGPHRHPPPHVAGTGDRQPPGGAGLGPGGGARARRAARRGPLAVVARLGNGGRGPRLGGPGARRPGRAGRRHARRGAARAGQSRDERQSVPFRGRGLRRGAGDLEPAGRNRRRGPGPVRAGERLVPAGAARRGRRAGPPRRSAGRAGRRPRLPGTHTGAPRRRRRGEGRRSCGEGAVRAGPPSPARWGTRPTSHAAALSSPWRRWRRETSLGRRRWRRRR